MQNKTDIKRVAIIITGGNIFIPKGLINACINRARFLMDIADYQINVFNVKYEYCPWNFKKWLSAKHQEDIVVGTTKVRILWKREYFSSNWVIRKILKVYYRLFKKKVSSWDWEWLQEYVHYFRNYNLLSTHSDLGAKIGMKVKEKYGIPFVVTWHGSDIHTSPFENEAAREVAVKAMENASYNFFVSNALMAISDKLTTNAKKAVLYNGVGDEFIRFNEPRRKELRKEFRINNGNKVIAFAGTLREIKNADSLPDIFAAIKDKYHDNLKFWIIGNGSLEHAIREKSEALGLDCVLWGFQPIEKMPDLLNCVDVLVLPSKNEGLPLITLEAIACGANVVGTRVGGIPEAIGADFCVDYSEDYIPKFADKVVELLNYPQEQFRNDCFSWEETAKKENGFYELMLNN